MITVDAVCVTVAGLERVELERWIARSWVQPAGGPDAWLFRPVDVARVRLIRELRVDLAVGEDALPLVLDLMDRLYAERRRLRRLREVIEGELPAEGRARLRELLAAADSGP